MIRDNKGVPGYDFSNFATEKLKLEKFKKSFFLN